MNIGIFGLGLIGGSIGRATVKKTDHKVFGTDKFADNVMKAKLLNAIHQELTDENLMECDMVCLAVYPQTAIEIMNKILPKLKDGAIVFDCCGTKRKIVKAMEEAKKQYPSLHFVGIHPMAGREFSGISHAIPTLFENSFTIVTPIEQDMQVLTTVRNFFMELGSIGIEVASGEKHDKMISYTSQLAHVLSSSYIKNPLSSSYAGFSAGSFRDMTRVAKLSPSMWTELCLENGDNLVEQIDNLIFHLEEYKKAIKNGDEKRLYSLFEEGSLRKAEAEELIKKRKKNDKN